MDREYKSWLTIAVGIITSVSIVLLVIIATQSYLWGLAALFATLAWVFISGFDGSKDIWPKPQDSKKQQEIVELKKEGVRVPIGFKGVLLFLGHPLGTTWIEEVEEEKIPRASGYMVDAGYPWLLPGMTLRLVDTRLQIVPIDQLAVYASDNIPVVIDTNATYLVSSPHQTLLIGGEGEIEEAIDELMESVIREVATNNTSTELRLNPKHRKTIKESILKLVKKIEGKFGIDIIDVYVGTVKLPSKVEEALERKKLNELYVDARRPLEDAKIPIDEIKEVAQFNAGVAEAKKMSENKADVGSTLAKVISEALTIIVGTLANSKKK